MVKLMAQKLNDKISHQAAAWLWSAGQLSQFSAHLLAQILQGCILCAPFVRGGSGVWRLNYWWPNWRPVNIWSVLWDQYIQGWRGEAGEKVVRRLSYLRTVWLISCLGVLSVSHEGLTDYVAGAGLSVTATDTIGCAGCRPGFVEDPHRMRLEKPQSQITITLAGRVCAPLSANGRRLMWCGDQWGCEARPSSTHPSYLSCEHLSSLSCCPQPTGD